jgi:hypothetical protein
MAIARSEMAPCFQSHARINLTPTPHPHISLNKDFPSPRNAQRPCPACHKGARPARVCRALDLVEDHTRTLSWQTRGSRSSIESRRSGRPLEQDSENHLLIAGTAVFLVAMPAARPDHRLSALLVRHPRSSPRSWPHLILNSDVQILILTASCLRSFCWTGGADRSARLKNG